MKKIVIILVVVLVIFGFYFTSTYNKLVSANTAADAQWAQVETQYQRRFDLIPNLVNTVKGAMNQEQAVFNAIADARTRYAGATTPNEKAGAASEVESAFARLLVVMENYPQLQSMAIVSNLQAELEGTENRVSVERGRYNEAVRDYNLIVSRFPSSMVAGMTDFDSRTYFEAAAGTEVAPTVNL